MTNIGVIMTFYGTIDVDGFVKTAKLIICHLERR